MRAPVTKEHEVGTAGWVADRAIDCLRSGTGFSLIRLGDGEGRLLLYPDGISREMLGRHLIFWFGHNKFDDAAILAMQAVLVQAIDAADVLGVHTEAQGEFWEAPWAYVQRIGRTYEEGLCRKDMHRRLWDQGHLDRIAQECERIVAVTCRDVGDGLRDRYERQVDWVQIPEEGLTGKRATDHWQRFSRIEAQVADLCEPRVLCLVGAGVLGKGYTATAAYHGAVALDMGSVFDGWARVLSRSFLAGKMDEYAL